MIHGIPIIGTLLSFVVSFSMAIPFYFIWNALAPRYFDFLPKVWLKIPFWHAVGFFMIIPMLSWLIHALTPRLVSVSQKNECK